MVSVAHQLAQYQATPADIDAWLAGLAQRLPEADLKRVQAALARAQTLYGEQSHPVTCQPLFQHAVATAMMVDDLKLDTDALVATLLFSAPDKLPHWHEALADFGPDVLRLLDGLSKVRQLPLLAAVGHTDDPKLAHRQIEVMRKMMLAMVEDVRVVLVKLAWRTQTMFGLKHADEATQRRIARETMDLFAPLANRLGIWQIKWELEDLSFRFLEAERYKKIASLLDEKRSQREAYIDHVLDVLRSELAKAGIKGDIMGRPKHIFSIAKKMQKKRLEFHELYDIRAVRILVDSVKDCYTVLGIVHHLWRPIPGQFDDYIAHPKGNFYRSLHTAVIGPQDKGMEVQIRTFEMHQHAEMGVAAHWRYKEGGQQDAAYEEKISWLRQLLAWRDEIGGEQAEADQDMAEQFKNELFQDTVYVLTPQGRVIDLPYGASPIDFAYNVHTDLGHRCRGAKVNGHIVPLDYALQNGDRVEIITAKEGGPSLDWLRHGYLKSSRAIAKVRQWLKQQHQDVLIEQGKQVFDKVRAKLHLPHIDLEEVAERLHCKRPDDMFAAVGRGEIGPKQLGEAMVGAPAADMQPETPVNAADLVRQSRAGEHAQGILIEGVDNLMTILAKCCKPALGDDVVGFVTRGRGISIHRRNCKALTRLAARDPERLIAAAWGNIREGRFPVDITVEAQDRPALLRDVSEALSRDKTHITAANTLSRNGLALLKFTIEIEDLGQLRHVIAQIASVPGVTSVKRRDS